MPEFIRREAVVVHQESRPWTMGDNIQGLGIGEKITEGKKLEDVVLKVYVDKKLPKRQLDHPVPKDLHLPGIHETIVTDVEAIGCVEKEMNTGRARPATPGCGVGHTAVTVGTFGCLVRKRQTRQPLFILSNCHVLADEGLARTGDPVLQPGDLDGGDAATDVLGRLSEWIPFDFNDNGFPNLVDAAIAEVDSSQVSSVVHLIGVPKGASNFVRRGMRVRKSGRTTSYTEGLIKDVHYRMALPYKRPGGGSGRVRFRDQVLCTRYTAGGDSGSAVFNSSGKVVGLHFAGSPSTSIFNRIGHVLDALDIEIVTEKI